MRAFFSRAGLALTTPPAPRLLACRLDNHTATSTLSSSSIKVSAALWKTSAAFSSSSSAVEVPSAEFFSSRPYSHWKRDENVKAFLEFAAGKLEWEKVTREQLVELGGVKLLKMRPSISRLLLSSFPSMEILPWKFAFVPKGFWSNQSNQKRYLAWLSTELGLGLDPEKWQNIGHAEFAQNHGRTLLRLYNDSLYKLLQAHFPTLEVYPWLFHRARGDIWDDLSVQKSYLQWLIARLGMKSANGLRHEDIKSNKGASLLFRYNNSVKQLLNALGNADASTTTESPTSSPSKPKTYLLTIDSQRDFMNELAHKLGFAPQDLDKWYAVTNKRMHENGAGTILVLHKSSMYFLLKTIFPEHNWVPWKFAITPKSALKSPEELRRVLKHVADSLGLKTLDDWNRISSTQLNDLGVRRFFQLAGGLKQVLNDYKDFLPHTLPK